MSNTEVLKNLLAESNKEVAKCYEIAQILDSLNPELIGAWQGTPSERIMRQLFHLEILNETCSSEVLNKVGLQFNHNPNHNSLQNHG